MATQVWGGKAQLQFGKSAVPSFMISEVTVEVTEAVRSRDTLAGTFSRPAGTIETAQATMTMYLRSVEDLEAIFPGQYNAPTSPEDSGNIIIGSSSCATSEGGPLNIHFECEDTDNKDVFFYNAIPLLNFNTTYNSSDDLTVEVTFLANPDDDGNVVRIGTSDLTMKSKWDYASENTVPVS